VVGWASQPPWYIRNIGDERWAEDPICIKCRILDASVTRHIERDLQSRNHTMLPAGDPQQSSVQLSNDSQGARCAQTTRQTRANMKVMYSWKCHFFLMRLGSHAFFLTVTSGLGRPQQLTRQGRECDLSCSCPLCSRTRWPPGTRPSCSSPNPRQCRGPSRRAS